MSKPFQESTSISPLLELTDAQRWEVERYVLGDDSFDRQAFEDRMLDDTRLALAVADCVAEVQNLKQACSGLEERVAVEATQVAIARRSWVWLLAGSLAACLLFAVWQRGVPSKEPANVAVAELANPWIGLATLTPDIGHDLPNLASATITPVGVPLDEVVLEDWSYEEEVAVGSESAEQEDWMLQVDEEFFDSLES